MFVVGKYKMRNGGDAEVVAVVDGIAIGYMYDTPENAESWSAKSGSIGCDDDCHEICGFDLIDPNAKKPIKVEVWVTVYPGICPIGYSTGGAYPSLEVARAHRYAGCIAITKVEIDCMEGDNLD